MATNSVATNDAEARALLTINVITTSTNPGNNTSQVSVSATISDNSAAYGGFASNAPWSVSINGGAAVTGTMAYDFTGNSGRSYTFYSTSFTVSHNSVGVGSTSATASWSGGGGTPGSATVSTTETVDFNRSPTWIDQTVSSSATVGVAYTDQVSANSASSYTVFSGSLPTGLSLNSSTGAITGTPNTEGSFTFVLRAVGSFEGNVNTATLTINVGPPLPSFTDSTVLSGGSLGSAYSDGVTASNGPTYSVFSGALPTGLSLNTSTGAITGTPSALGVFTFVIRATNATGTADTGTLTITITSGGKIWNGTAFVSATTRVWNGTSFVTSTTKIWNGSSWVSAT